MGRATAKTAKRSRQFIGKYKTLNKINKIKGKNRTQTAKKSFVIGNSRAKTAKKIKFSIGKPRAKTIKNNYATNSATSIELGYLTDLIWGRELKEKLKEQGINTSRAIFELSSPTTQCGSVLNIRNADKKPCYICGMSIDNSDFYTSNTGIKIPQGLTAECEHILPIAQAILFLGIYNAKAPEMDREVFIPPKEILKLEYRWAHRTCNQIKSNISFIHFNTATLLFEVNDLQLANLLKNIYNNNREDSTKFNELIKNFGSAKNFVEFRLPEARKPFEDICKYLNDFEAPGLLSLAGAISAMEGPMNIKAAELLSTPSASLTNRSKLGHLINAANLVEFVDEIFTQTRELLSPAVRIMSANIIKEFEEKHIENFAKLLNYTPDEIKESVAPYIKIRILNHIADILESQGKRQTTAVMRLVQNFLKQTSSINPEIMDQLKNLEKKIAPDVNISDL